MISDNALLQPAGNTIRSSLGCVAIDIVSFFLSEVSCYQINHIALLDMLRREKRLQPGDKFSYTYPSANRTLHELLYQCRENHIPVEGLNVPAEQAAHAEEPAARISINAFSYDVIYHASRVNMTVIKLLHLCAREAGTSR